MSYPTVYCTNAALDRIFTSPEKYPELYNIIHDYSNVMVDVDDDEIFKDPYLKILAKRPHFETFGLKAFFETFEDQEIENFARDLFILNRDQLNCNELREKFGVCVMAEDALEEVSLLSTDYYWQLVQNDLYEQAKPDGQSVYGWESLLRQIAVVPMNAMVVNDNYLFNQSIADGTVNIISFLNAVLPKSLDVAFELLIVTMNEGAKLTPIKLEEIAKSIQAKVQRSYKVKVDIMTHTNNVDFHMRAIITNYHLFKSDRGFDAFREGKVKRRNDLEIKGAYTAVTKPIGDIRLKTMREELLSAAKQLTKNIQGGNKIVTELLYGDGKNRLLRDFTN